MNLKTGRRTPPEEDEWPDIYARLDMVPKIWVIVGPFWAIFSNWKAICIVGSIIMAIVVMARGPELTDLLLAFLGGGK